MSNTYYLVRHGQDQDNQNSILNGHRDTPLTEIGIEQANTLANEIKKLSLKIDLILSSPLQRAFKTATILSEKLSLAPPLAEPLLIERNFGIMTGKKHSDILPLCSPDILKTVTVTYFLSPPDSESFPDLLKRAQKLLAKLDRDYQDSTLILTTHGDFGKMIYAQYYQLDWQQVLKDFHFGNSEMLKLSSTTKPENSHQIKIEQYNI